MLLAVDIGNTKIAAGLFAAAEAAPEGKAGAGPVCHWRLASSAERTEDEYSVTLSGLFATAGYAQSDITGAILCSVVPSLTDVVASAVGMCVGAAPVVLGDGEAASVASGMAVLADEAREVGADRVVNAHSAFSACGGPVVVVDIGTAVTVDLVNAAGEFCGGAIAPGLMISAEALHRGTARLPMTDPARPERAVGRNTAESMRSGLYYGWCALVDGMIDAVAAEAAGEPKVVATGGDAVFIGQGSRRISVVDEFLTLKGLKLIFDNI